MKNINNNRYTIGMLTKELDSRYHAPLWRGVNHVAEEKDMNLIMFVDDFIRTSTQFESIKNMVYTAANPERLDGLITAPSALVRFLLQNQLDNFLAQFKSTPIVSIAVPMEGIPSIIADGKSGIKKITKHLIESHGCKNIAFIKGTEVLPESHDRFLGYQEALEEHHIPIRDEYIYQGTFMSPSGEEAVREFLVKRALKIDAIVASNDEMALGAYQAIKEMGLRIPEDIAVTGFDDMDLAQIMSPPLTTVKNPIYDIAVLSTELLYERIQGKQVPMITSMPSSPVFRQSCGCIPKSLAELRTKQIVLNIQNPEKANPFDIDTIINLMDLPEQRKTNVESKVKDFLDAILFDLKNEGKTKKFLNFLGDTLSQIDYDKRNIHLWKDKVAYISNYILLNMKDQNLISLTKDMLDNAQLLICDTIIKKETELKIENDTVLWNVREILNSISSAINLDNVMKIIEDSFPQLGIKSAYITRFTPGEEKNDAMEKRILPPQSILLTAFNDKHFFTRERAGIEFPTREIIPDSMLPLNRRYTMIIMPLVKQMDFFGLFMSELGPKVDIIYRILREQISNSLVSCDLFFNNKQNEFKLKSTFMELQKSEERFREMAMFLPTIIIETDLNLDIIFLNHVAYELFGLNPNQHFSNINLSSFIQQENRVKFKEKCDRIIYGELPNLSEFKLVNREGQEINLISRASLIQRDNKIEGIRWSAIDIKSYILSIFSPDYTFFNKYRFSLREKEIVDLTIQGYKIKEIAEKLFVSESAVKYHISSIYFKMNIKNKNEFFESVKNYQVGRFGKSSYLFSILSRIIKE